MAHEAGKGPARRPGQGYAEGITRIIGARCIVCRGGGFILQKAPNPKDAPQYVPCPTCKKE